MYPSEKKMGQVLKCIRKPKQICDLTLNVIHVVIVVLCRLDDYPVDTLVPPVDWVCIPSNVRTLDSIGQGTIHAN